MLHHGPSNLVWQLSHPQKGSSEVVGTGGTVGLDVGLDVEGSGTSGGEGVVGVGVTGGAMVGTGDGGAMMKQIFPLPSGALPQSQPSMALQASFSVASEQVVGTGGSVGLYVGLGVEGSGTSGGGGVVGVGLTGGAVVGTGDGAAVGERVGVGVCPGCGM